MINQLKWRIPKISLANYNIQCHRKSKWFSRYNNYFDLSFNEGREWEYDEHAKCLKSH